MPTVRHQGIVSATVSDIRRKQPEAPVVDLSVLSTRLAYERRLANRICTKPWPYLFSGRMLVTLGVERLDLLAGSFAGTGLSEGTVARLEISNLGSITRAAPYVLTTGVAFDDRNDDTRFYLRLTTSPLTQPFRQDESPQPFLLGQEGRLGSDSFLLPSPHSGWEQAWDNLSASLAPPAHWFVPRIGATQ